MIGIGLMLLKTVSRSAEVPLSTVLRLAKTRHGSHLDQYPLALLIEEGYLGCTFNYTPPEGAEAMREHCLAITLHMFTLPKNADGTLIYRGVRSTGGIDPAEEKVFIKAKGALYLDEKSQRLKERWWSFALGLCAGLLVAVGSMWIKALLRT